MSDSELFEQGPEEDLDRRYVNEVNEDEVEDEVNEDEVNEDEVEDEVNEEVEDEEVDEDEVDNKRWNEEAIDHQWDEEEEAGGVDYAGMGGEPPFVLEGEKPNDIVENVVNDAVEEHCETTEEAGKEVNEGEAEEEAGPDNKAMIKLVTWILETMSAGGNFDNRFRKSTIEYYAKFKTDMTTLYGIRPSSKTITLRDKQIFFNFLL